MKSKKFFVLKNFKKRQIFDIFVTFSLLTIFVDESLQTLITSIWYEIPYLTLWLISQNNKTFRIFSYTISNDEIAYNDIVIAPKT